MVAAGWQTKSESHGVVVSDSLYSHRQWISANVPQYAGFTDVEFNPSRSVNCQARSFALMISLIKNGLLDSAMESPRRFGEVVGATPMSRKDWAWLASRVDRRSIERQPDV
jgi:hypothetical protein